MKIVLETIPVWDGIKANSECMLCSLMKEAERDSLSYYLSSAVMTPEVRVETNRYGFCHDHFRKLAQAGKPQVLALIMDTYYSESDKTYKSLLNRITTSPRAGAAAKAITAFSDAVQDRDKGCLICTRMEDRLYRYCYTIAALYQEDPDFKRALESSKGFCIQHTLKLAEVAKDVLGGDSLLSFYRCIFSLLDSNLDRVHSDDVWMTQMYKSENKGKSWNGCEDAQKRAVYKLVGECEVVDPIKGKKSKI